MISVIIPTLLKVQRLYKTLEELSNCDEVGEIILIDNTTNTIPFQIPKLIHICEGVNTFVNPAWNKGASLAKYDKLCFLNDDIWFDWNYLKLITQFITPQTGFIGMSPDNYTQPKQHFNIVSIEPDNKTLRGHRPIGFACCLFVHKHNWDPIPDDIKIWAGDDWLFYRSRNKNLMIEGIKLHGELSATSSDVELDAKLGPIKTNDMYRMLEYVKTGLVDNYLIGTIWWK